MKLFIKKFIPLFLFNFYYWLLPAMGAFLYGFPSKELTVIGVTGTNGKSTVVNLATRILEEAPRQAQGKQAKVASLSSIQFKIGKKEWKNDLKMTMPGRFKLQKFLRQAVDAGCQYAVLEVTSEGIKQYRHKFIDFDVAVFTNLTPEHIESHGSFENYKEAKGELFKSLKRTANNEQRTITIVNLDDENAEYFLQFSSDQKLGYTIRGSRTSPIDGNWLSVIKAEGVQVLSSGLRFRIRNLDFNLSLLGEFNVYNALAAICVGLSQGIDLETCKKALEKVEGIPGRLEIVIREPFTVVVDYAHTPDALVKVYETLTANSEQRTANKMICVLGAAGGGRDKWKRPELGKIAAKYCDQIILTNEDPYDENPDSILNEIESGFSQIRNQKHEIRNYMKVLDRKEAIKKALSLAQAGDIVIITGKGCEPWMMTKKGKIPWDDRKIVKEEITRCQSTNAFE